MWERLDESDYLKAPHLTGTLFAATLPSLSEEAGFLLLGKPVITLPGAVIL